LTVMVDASRRIDAFPAWASPIASSLDARRHRTLTLKESYP
jgi:hypothetical protein